MNKKDLKARLSRMEAQIQLIKKLIGPIPRTIPEEVIGDLVYDLFLMADSLEGELDKVRNEKSK